MTGKGSVIKLAVLAILAALIVVSSLFTGLTNTDVSAGCGGCLRGTAVKHLIISSPEVVKPASTALEVTALLNVTYISESREFLVQLTVNLTPTNGAEASIFYTPPLLDMVIYSDVGRYVWSADKVFIQAVLERQLPLSESINMKIKASCIYGVEAVIKPLKLCILFGEQVSPLTTSSGTEVSYYVVHGIFNPPVRHGDVSISRISLIVAAPKEMPASVVESEVRELLAFYLGNLSETLEVHVVRLAQSEICVRGGSVALGEVTPRTVPHKPSTTPTSAFGIAEAVTTRTPTVTSTTKLSARTLVKPCESAPQLATTPITVAASLTTQQTRATVRTYVPRELSLPIAIAIALIAGLAAYATLIKPLK
ncbi:MAG: hypothetical protein J7L12_04925 [Desulfurococcales archaeon]|nr:hypothetical protein [Desulfurococcales archaeon]